MYSLCILVYFHALEIFRQDFSKYVEKYEAMDISMAEKW